MSEMTRLSFEEPDAMTRTFVAVMGRACANTTGWYFALVDNRIQSQEVVCEINFPTPSGIRGQWYALTYADLTGATGERFYRLCERIESDMAAQRVQALANRENVAATAPVWARR